MSLRTLIVSLAIAGFGITSSHVAAREPLVLTASSNWNIDYAEDKCRLVRFFGEGDNRVELHFEQATEKPYYNLALFGEPVDKTRNEVMEVAFGPAEGSTTRSYVSGDLDSATPFLLMHGIHLAPVPKGTSQGEFAVVDIGTDREEAIQYLILSKGLRKPLRLEIGPMDAPLNAMRTCVADLVDTLKLDEEGQAELLSKPVPTDLQEIARHIQKVYPARMLREGDGGTVGVQLVVNPNGKPTVCQIATSDRPAAFDDLVCIGLLQVAEFSPAIGPDGEPRYGLYSTRVTYRLNDKPRRRTTR